MTKAIWNNTVIAESDQCEQVEGNYYFPPDSVERNYLSDSPHTSRCPWKGVAHYYDLNVKGKVNPNSAWYYPEPSSAAAHIKDYVAFWNGVDVVE
ncbi:DUF427 domain-containing protein [Legionella sp. W05-934-2]|uniref:DUF427 domain-containing protein n=1 Tax=Legionella sp. W05-934-2 TaxID=1198649 RepID=UPI0034635CEF